MAPPNRIAYLLGLNQELELPRKRQPKESQLSTFIAEDLHDAVRDYHDATGVSIKRIVEDALRAYLTQNYWKVGDNE